jgi:transposase
VRQRTQLINAIRGHLSEYGWVAPKGPSHVAMLADLIEEEEMASSLPEAAHAMFRLMLDLLAGLNDKIADLDKEIARRAREDEVSRRLMTVDGIGPISATAIAALAPPAETFAKGREFAAWLGLTPLQRSIGGMLLAQGTATELSGSGNAYVSELLRTPRRQAERLGKLLPRDGAV